MNTVKMTVISVSLVASLATVAYAGKVKLAGDFDNTSEPNARVYIIECSKGGKTCASIKDGGFHFDNIFGAFIECEGGGEVEEIANKPGGKAKACLQCPTGEAEVVLFCSETSEFCDDGFIAKVTCKGKVEFFEEFDIP